jgi:hypothetical protein
MNLKGTIAVVGILLCFGAFNVKAQSNPAYTPAQLQAAETLLKATGIDKQFEDITNTMLSTLGNQIPQDKKASFVEVMKKFMGKYFSWDVIKADLSAMYASEFSEADLKELTAFYNTPAGKRFSQKLPILTQKGALMGQKIIQDHQAELQQMMKDAFKQP